MIERESGRLVTGLEEEYMYICLHRLESVREWQWNKRLTCCYHPPNYMTECLFWSHPFFSSRECWPQEGGWSFFVLLSEKLHLGKKGWRTMTSYHCKLRHGRNWVFFLFSPTWERRHVKDERWAGSILRGMRYDVWSSGQRDGRPFYIYPHLSLTPFLFACIDRYTVISDVCVCVYLFSLRL